MLVRLLGWLEGQAQQHDALEDPVVDPEKAFAIAMAFAARDLDVPWRPRRTSAKAASGRSRRR